LRFAHICVTLRTPRPIHATPHATPAPA